ncbi:MAG: BrnT family toxin [Pseudomonadota bacterium]
MGFEVIAGFDWQAARIRQDTRRDYGEPRYQALGMIDQRLYLCVFTLRDGQRRIISLRKANRREVRSYGK